LAVWLEKIPHSRSKSRKIALSPHETIAMARYIDYNYAQTALIPIDFEEQIQPGTFEHAVHHLVDHKLDLSCFDAMYNNDDNGRPAYDPAILLKIILLAYSKGITSSREIAWCCRTNIIFMALSCQSSPHFTTIAEFISGHPEKIEGLFEQVLLICDQQGLLGKELFAIDGCKMPSNASKEWSGTHKELANKRDKIKRLITHHVKKHQQLDLLQREDEETSLQKQRSLQAIDTLNLAADKIEDFLKHNEPRQGKGKQKKEVKSNITDNESAKMTTSKGTIQGYNGVAAVDKKHQIVVNAQAFGEGQEHHTLKPILDHIKASFNALGIHNNILASNTIITADTGFANEANMQYLHDEHINAYIPDNQFRSRDPKFKHQKQKYPRASRAKETVIYPASQFTFDPTTLSCICPSGETLSPRGLVTDAQGNQSARFEGRLTQCRHCAQKHHCMRNPDAANHRKGNGRQVSFQLIKGRKPTYTDWMKHRVDSDKGKRIYSHRMSVVEPVFGNLEFNKNLKRFTLRGLKKINAQWKLFCLIQNIEKLANYGRLTA
jgi:transposase